MDRQESGFIVSLIEKFKAGTLSVLEQVELEKWIDTSETNKNTFAELVHDEALLRSAKEDYASLLRIQKKAKQRIGQFPIPETRSEGQVTQTNVYPMRIKRWMVAAAVVLVALLSGLYYRSIVPKGNLITKNSSQEKLHNDLLPGGNKAVLILASGARIILDSADNGRLSIQPGAFVEKKEDGELAYMSISSNSSSGGEQDLAYNTLSTPRGGRYLIKLSDGSKVWLNAMSSLRYPTTFGGGERKVELTGEAYFEVAKNKAMPFHVQVNEMEIEVLGTEFNVNSYRDEPNIKTSLLKGSVKVGNRNSSAILKPGQQAVMLNEKDIKVIDADLEEAIAWKNGVFQFNDASLNTVMRQLSRWYDVDKILYEGKIKPSVFSGKIRRDYKASDVLKILELSNVHFRIEGKTIIVMP